MRERSIERTTEECKDREKKSQRYQIKTLRISRIRHFIIRKQRAKSTNNKGTT